MEEAARELAQSSGLSEANYRVPRQLRRFATSVEQPSSFFDSSATERMIGSSSE
jgi:hypothetical protein